MIEIKGITKKFKDVCAVKDVTLSIPKGELFALLGVNGAGKTTLIRMLSGLIRPTEGDAEIDGKSILMNSAAVKGIIGLSPQETAVAPNLTVYENLSMMAGVQGLNKAEAKERTDRMIDEFSLSGILKKRAGRLSGGWQRRLSLAMALVKEPKVLFLDEPTLGLDVLARRELWDAIERLKGRVTIVLTTHYMEEAESLSDRIGIMKNGRLLTTGTSRELMEASGTNRFEDAFVEIIRRDGV